jgi:hypothetical protein
MQNLTSFLTGISTDWILVFALFAFIAFDVLRSGSSRAIALSIAIPLSGLLAQSIAGAAVAGGLASQFTTPLLKTSLLVALTFASFLLVLRMMDRYNDDDGRPVQSLAAGIAVTAIIVSVWTQNPQWGTIWQFGDAVQHLFGEAYRFWWLIGGYAVLALVRRGV